MNKKKLVVIIGGTGYIGQYLIDELSKKKTYRVKILTRIKLMTNKNISNNKVEVFQGNMLEPETLNGLFEPGCIVINLMYSWTGGESKNLEATENLLNACVAAKIKRIIHCSTVAVVGPTSEKNVTELTQCRPISSYGKTKLKIENIIIETGRNNFEVIVVRPTSVFGPNGAPLQKLTNNLIVSGAKLTNYLRSSLFGVRRMNLVSVANVVAAIEFLINERKKIYFEIFILSDDDSSLNNFIGVENYLINYFKLDGYSIPRMKLPLVFLELILRIMGRNSPNPKCIYLSNKLKNWGFNKPVKLDEALAEYALWYKSNKFLSR